jgi:hypothetical protein
MWVVWSLLFAVTCAWGGVLTRLLLATLDERDVWDRAAYKLLATTVVTAGVTLWCAYMAASFILWR